MSKIVVNISSYKRNDGLEKVINSVIEDCDKINVALNSYEGEIPKFLFDNKINILITDNSKGDAYKFYFLNNTEDAYYITLDDDIIYPKNFIKKIIQKCDFYERKKVITYHGRNFENFPIQSYYKSKSKRYHFLQEVSKDTKVQFGGTGLMCFHTNLLKIPFEYFIFPNMADVWLGKYCMENKIEIICLKHLKGYIQYIPQKTTIYDVESKNDFIQTQVVNSIFNKTINLENLKNYNKNNSLEQIPNISIPQPTPPPHEPVKIEKTLEINKKTIDYQKVNRIFSNLQNNTQQTPQVNTNNLKLNSKQISTFNKKKFR
jgi:hypothetical protein